MKIGIFTNCYLPLINGVVGAVALLRKGFLEQGHDVHIFAPAYDDYRDEEPHIYRYRSVDLTKQVKYPVAIPFSPRIAKLIAAEKFDVFHAHHPFVLGPLALKLARRHGIPIVSTFHTQYDQYNHYVPLPASFVSWYSRRQVRCFNQAVDGVTTPADSAREILQKYGVTRSVKVIPNPTDLSKFQQGNGKKVRAGYGLSDSDGVLVNIGRVAPEKNLDLLLQAFQDMVRKSAQPLKLMIVGDGPELPRLRRIASEMGLNENVIFSGMVQPEDIPDYLASADVFVMTSKSEVKPLAQLEALAAGVPIVAVAAAGANDTIEHGINGLLVKDDVKEIGQAVLGLLNDEARLRAFGKAARKTAERYSYPVIAGEYIRFFEEIVRGVDGLQ